MGYNRGVQSLSETPLRPVLVMARRKRRRYTIEDMKSLAHERGGRCLSLEYINVRTHLMWECAEGHQWLAVPDSVVRGHWCRQCARKRVAAILRVKLRKHTIQEMRSLAAKRGGECLSNEYVNTDTKLVWRCAEGHTWEQRPDHILAGRWCRACAGNAPLSLDELREIAATRGGECLAESYVNSKTDVLWECSLGHQWYATFNNVKRGTWCKECSTGLGERICRVFFEQLFERPFPKRRPVWLTSSEGSRLELDGYCEELGLAFEHQGEQHYRAVTGLYTDSDKLRQRRALDQRKRYLCKKRGICLVEIPEVPRLTSIDDLRRVIADACERNRVVPPRGFWRREIDLKPAYASPKLEEMKKIAEARGGKCLSSQYVDMTTKLRWQCSEGHTWNTAPTNIASGRWCPECAGNVPLSLEDCQGAAHKRGGLCLSKRYVNAHQHMLWKCEKGHKWRARAAPVIYGRSWCSECSGRKRKTLKDMRTAARRFGGKCLSKEYLGANKKLSWKCAAAHVFERTPNHVINESRWCPDCTKTERARKVAGSWKRRNRAATA